MTGCKAPRTRLTLWRYRNARYLLTSNNKIATKQCLQISIQDQFTVHHKKIYN